MEERAKASLFVRNFVFGVEDSLVSTVGLLSGISAAGAENRTIIISGIILIFVEAFSMAVGSFLSDQSAEEYRNQRDLPIWSSLGGGLIMLVSYFISGFIPLSPYFLFDNGTAFSVSIILSVIALFVLGIAGSKLSRVNMIKGGLQMALIGGIAIGIGVLVGGFFK